MTPLTNAEVAGTLETIGELLEAQDANPFRVRAYRMAAQTVRGLKQPIARLYETEGVDGLRKLPAIGESLARSLEQLLTSGRIGLLDRLRGETGPERVLGTVAGIGPILAARIHEQLGIESLFELEAAANDGRLAQVPGFGRDRLRAVRESLAGRFRRRPEVPVRAQATPMENEPAVSELLDIDREYVKRAAAKSLPRIAPRRFNPTGEAWLPVLHTQRSQTHYTALYSNTARAHELGATKDWVVIYRDDHGGAGQWTVVTAHFGPLKGKRVVRGREPECIQYYAALPGQANTAVPISGVAQRSP